MRLAALLLMVACLRVFGATGGDDLQTTDFSRRWLRDSIDPRTGRIILEITNQTTVTNLPLSGTGFLHITDDLPDPEARAVDISTDDILGNLDVSHLDGGANASAFTVWWGDGTWRVVPSFVTGTGTGVTNINGILYAAIDPGNNVGFTTNALGRISISATASSATNAPFTPTGTGFSHVTGSVWDAAARAVNLATADVTGNLPVNNLNSGSGASALTVWWGDGTWRVVPSAPVPTGTGWPHITGGAQDAAARAVDISTADITGNLPVTRLNSGASASAGTFWSGNGTWQVVPGTTVPAGTGFRHVTSNTEDIAARAVNLATADVTGNLDVSHLSSGFNASSASFWRGDGLWVSGLSSPSDLNFSINSPGDSYIIASGNTAAGVQFWRNGSSVWQNTLNNSLGRLNWVGSNGVSQLSLAQNGILNAVGGYQAGGLATNGTYLRGNGTAFLGSPLLASDMTGNLPTNVFNGGAGADTTTFWRGDGTWTNSLVSTTGNVNFSLVSPSQTLFSIDGFASSGLQFLKTGIVQWQIYPVYPPGHLSWFNKFGIKEMTIKTNGILDTLGGYTINATADNGTYLRGNGTAFIESPLLASDLTGTIPSTSVPLFTGAVTNSAGTPLVLQIAPSGVNSGLYGTSTSVGQFSVAPDGRLLFATNVPIAFPAGSGAGASASTFWRGDQTWTNALAGPFETYNKNFIYSTAGATPRTGPAAYMWHNSFAGMFGSDRFSTNDLYTPLYLLAGGKTGLTVQTNGVVTLPFGFVSQAGSAAASAVAGTDFGTAALVLREQGYSGSQGASFAYTPRLGFNYNGVVAAQLALHPVDGSLSALNSDGSAFAKLRGSIVDSTGGFTVGSVAPAGKYLRGDGSVFLSSSLLASDLTGTIPSTSVPLFTGAVTNSAGTPLVLQIAPSGVNSGLYGTSTSVGQFSVAPDGRLLFATNVPIVFPAGYTPPTGTGWPHITSGAQDAAARAVDLSGADVTGILNPARVSGGYTGITKVGALVSQTADANYPYASLTVSEAFGGGVQTASFAYAPRIAFLWNGRGAGQLAWDPLDGYLTFLDSTGTAYKNYKGDFFDAQSGFTIGKAGAVGKYLRGQGTAFVSSSLLASDMTGNLPIGSFGGGANANTGTFWRGDGQWANQFRGQDMYLYVIGTNSAFQYLDAPGDVGYIWSRNASPVWYNYLASGSTDMIWNSGGTKMKLTVPGVLDTAAGYTSGGAQAILPQGFNSTALSQVRGANFYVTSSTTPNTGNVLAMGADGTQAIIESTHYTTGYKPLSIRTGGAERIRVSETGVITMPGLVGPGYVSVTSGGVLGVGPGGSGGTVPTGIGFHHNSVSGVQDAAAVAVNLATADVTGNLPVNKLNSGTGATVGSFWRGDGTWSNTINTDSYTGFLYSTPSVNANARNWFAGANMVQYGDFGFKQSVALGGDPKQNGNVQLRIQGDGILDMMNGFVLTSVATAGKYPRGNGTAFVSSSLLSSDLTGNLPISIFNGGGANANSGSFWRGDGVWANHVVGNWQTVNGGALYATFNATPSTGPAAVVYHNGTAAIVSSGAFTGSPTPLQIQMGGTVAIKVGTDNSVSLPQLAGPGYVSIDGTGKLGVGPGGSSVNYGTFPIRKVTANTTFADSDYTLVTTLASTLVTFTLPPAAGRQGKVFVAKAGFNGGGGTSFTLAPGSGDTIDGGGALTVTAGTQQSLMVQSDGANTWYLLQGGYSGLIRSPQP